MKGDKRASVDEALALFLGWVQPLNRVTTISIDEADDRVLSQSILAPMDYPHYPQVILDGYAVKAADVPRNSVSAERTLLKVSARVENGCCKLIHTGDALPEGADAVLPLEDAEESEGSVAVLKSVIPGQWIWNAGAGLKRDAIVFRDGMQLKPTDIAILAKLGIAAVPVYDKPRVLIIPTGDELVKAGGELKPGIVFESNGLMVSMLIKRYGGVPALHDIVPDDVEEIRKILSWGQKYDLVVTIGGSSASKRDLMDAAASDSGRLAFHGVSLHPGNHMGAGEIASENGRTPIICLPGYTESCAVAAFVFVNAAIRKLGHYPQLLCSHQRAVLERKVTTPVGVRSVRKMCLVDGKAIPIALIGDSSRAGSYAYLVVPEDKGELGAGEEVECAFLE
jgi:molybdopterin molybdotransferase